MLLCLKKENKFKTKGGIEKSTLIEVYYFQKLEW